MQTYFLNSYWICYNIASVLGFGFFGLKASGSQLPDQRETRIPHSGSLSHWTAREVPIAMAVSFF